MISNEQPSLSDPTFSGLRTDIQFLAYKRLRSGHTPWVCLSIRCCTKVKDHPKPPKAQNKNEEKLWGNSGREARQLERLRRLFAKMDELEGMLCLLSRLAWRVAPG